MVRELRHPWQYTYQAFY